MIPWNPRNEPRNPRDDSLETKALPLDSKGSFALLTLSLCYVELTLARYAELQCLHNT